MSDIDVATDAEPGTVLELLGAAMIRAVPTGIEHGTVTAVPATRSFEITTLRRDVATDGRRAEVQFTKDWVEDASRRDFTFNALSADQDGKVYDYFGGLEDLKDGRIRFIGDALERVAEDYLRVLRYFRFYAHYAKTEPDPDSFAACRAVATHVENLSGERIWAELSRTLITHTLARDTPILSRACASAASSSLLPMPSPCSSGSTLKSPISALSCASRLTWTVPSVAASRFASRTTSSASPFSTLRAISAPTGEPAPTAGGERPDLVDELAAVEERNEVPGHERHDARPGPGSSEGA